MGKSPGIATLVLVAAIGAAGCKTARAATPVDRPNLEVPPAPPRVIEPVPVEAPPPEPAGELPTTTSTTPTKPRPTRDQPAPKPETKPETPPETPPATVPPPPNPPQLRAPGMASPETAGAIRAILDRANAILRNIDYGKLTRPRQASYDTAKRFAEEGEKELKAANYVLAKELAEKAERLARELQSR